MTSHNQTSTHIDLSQLLAGLEQPLQLMTEPESRERLQAYVAAARPQVERAAFDLLSQVVTVFNDASTYQRASLEYAGGGLNLRMDDTGDSEPETTFDDSDLERVTLRLPKELKELIDRAAERHGMSANTWYVRALTRMIARHFRDAMPEDQRSGRHGRRRGYRGRGRGGRHGFGGDIAD